MNEEWTTENLVVAESGVPKVVSAVPLTSNNSITLCSLSAVERGKIRSFDNFGSILECCSMFGNGVEDVLLMGCFHLFVFSCECKLYLIDVTLYL